MVSIVEYDIPLADHDQWIDLRFCEPDHRQAQVWTRGWAFVTNEFLTAYYSRRIRSAMPFTGWVAYW